jgi:crotonobetainyl-CoA:carnitine CoA-transferase CaiB-like acyl-CoA transferase
MGLGREFDMVTVVPVEQAIAAPFCGLLLANAGLTDRPGFGHRGRVVRKLAKLTI